MGSSQREKAGPAKGGRKKKEPTPEELERLALKAKAADELGLHEKLRLRGWGGLSAAETGRVGALVSRWLRQGSA